MVEESKHFYNYQTLVCAEHGEYLSATYSLKGESRVTGCPACASIKQESDTKKLLKDNEQKNQLATIKAVINRAAIPPSFAHCTFENYAIYAGDEQNKVVNNLRYFAENFDLAKTKNIHGILTGSTGTGKTHLSAAVINELIKRGYTAVFATMSDITNTIATTFTDRKQSKQSVISRFIDIDLLIIDEAAVTNSNFELGEIFHIINKRYELKRPTLLITNIIDDLKLKLGHRIISRMQQGKFIQVFNWDDYRLKDSNNSGV
mgnify:CR=1 FL=1